MNTCCIYGVNFLYAGDFFRNGFPSNFMNQLTKTGIFLGRPSYHRKWPDGIFSCIYFVHPHQRKGVGEAIIAKVVTKWTFRFVFSWINFASDDEIGISANRKSIFISISESSSTQHAGEHHFTNAFGEGHNGRNRICRGATYENAYF